MKLIYVLSIILSLISCKTSENKLLQIAPGTFTDNKITLSDIADDITYIPMDNSIPFVSFKYVITSNSFYFAAKGIGILQFNRGGKLIKKIGSRGRGPGEFWYGMTFTVDELTGNVFVQDPGKIKIYSNSGIFLRDISLIEYSGGNGFLDVELYNSLLFFPNDLAAGASNLNWVFLDTLGNFIKKKENSVPPFQSNLEMNCGIYKYKNNLCYYNYYNDTIFSISPDLSYNAAYLFAQGDHRWPGARIEFHSQAEFSSKLFKLFTPGTMFETDKFIVLQYSYLDKSVLSFTDKKTKKTYLSMKYENIPNSFSKTLPSLYNDLDAGMPLMDIRYYSEGDKEYITTLINPSDLKKFVTSPEFKGSVPKYPEKKKELELLANGLKETDNPVLVFMRLKTK
jgi:hypothetical protein